MYSRQSPEEERLREERLRFVRDSVQRLGTLQRAAEAVRDEALARELAEQSETGRAVLADLHEPEGAASGNGSPVDRAGSDG